MPIQAEITSQAAPIRIWSPMHEVESAAIDQLKNVSNLPGVVAVAAMPDIHMGNGASVGTVMASKGTIVPSVTGVDIGCGMAAWPLPFDVSRIQKKLPEIRDAIEKAIPTGFNGHSREVGNRWKGWSTFAALTVNSKIDADEGKFRKQLGSLGGGNHFIEICLDENDKPWLMLHSGSRNVGKTIAEIHINRASSILRENKVFLTDPELAYYVESQSEFKDYINDLLWAQDYAAANREIMFEEAVDAIAKVVTGYGYHMSPAEQRAIINCHHNYAAKEIHGGQELWVTRKGAVNAEAGKLGIIPGSMGTKSFIVRGKGEPLSFNSCSHGAGRRMSRGMAKRTFTLADLAQQTAGVECRKDAGVLDEIPGSYKNIDNVMANQVDLVEVVHTIKQILCVKG